MKLKDFSDFVVFDAFPLAFDPQQKIILTHMLHLDEHTMPLKVGTIYTTRNISKHLLEYCQNRKFQGISVSNFSIIAPYEVIEITIEKRRTVQMLFCSPEAEKSETLMVLIKEHDKLNYLYAGNFVDIRWAVLNDTFASWILHGVEKLYLNLKRTDENHIFNDIDQMQKVFSKIEEIMSCHHKSQIHLYLPLFGYENFISKLATKCPYRVGKESVYDNFYIDVPNAEEAEDIHLRDDNVAKIILYSGKSTPHLAKIRFDNSNLITINIINERSKCTDSLVNLKNSFYELFYSPEPSPFHLKLLAMLVKPKQIYGILDTFNNKSKLPQYLIEFCVGARERIQKKQQRKLNESLRSSICTQINETPKTVFVGSTTSKINHKNGPFLSDSESDSES